MKKWYKSKSIMLNLIAALIASISMLDAEVLNAIGITNTSAFLSVIGFITTVGNIFLRIFTDQSQTIITKKSHKKNCTTENNEDAKGLLNINEN